MAVEFRMPALGADMESGTIVQWNVAAGSRVRRGDIVAVVETDKGAIDVEIFEDGVVREIVVPQGKKVPVGTVLATIESDQAEPAAVGAEPAAAPTTGPPEVRAPAPGPQAATAPNETPIPVAARGQATPERVRISPAARRRAHELGVEALALTGTGPEGAVTLEDVERAATAAAEGAPGPATAATAGGMRAAIAAAMSRSKREIPHYYLSATVDVTDAVAWLERHNAEVPAEQRLLFVAMLVKAVALGCSEIEGFSGTYRDGRYEQSPVVHVGVAVALRGGGLVAPAIMGTADKSLAELMSDFRALVMRARAGRLRASELAAPTIIVTSLGDSVVDTVFPIIQPPQVAIVGAGAVSTRAAVVDGAVVPRKLVVLSLGADHRVTDGRSGARFLAAVAGHLARPQDL